MLFFLSPRVFILFSIMSATIQVASYSLDVYLIVFFTITIVRHTSTLHIVIFNRHLMRLWNRWKKTTSTRMWRMNKLKIFSIGNKNIYQSNSIKIECGGKVWMELIKKGLCFCQSYVNWEREKNKKKRKTTFRINFDEIDKTNDNGNDLSGWSRVYMCT